MREQIERDYGQGQGQLRKQKKDKNSYEREIKDNTCSSNYVAVLVPVASELESPRQREVARDLRAIVIKGVFDIVPPF